ncbi:MAG: hypothetical protein KDI48_00755 [Xanthomonadales bacterium]|nr:hypothetical protein [Xanthomonadales bacterium]
MKRNKLQLLLLALVFVAPVVIAVLMQTRLAHYEPEATKNYGTLFETSPQLGAWLPPVEAARLHGSWTVAYLASADCGQDCLAELDLLSRVWAAQGQERDRVQLLYVTPTGITPPALAAPWLSHAREVEPAVPAPARVILIDPEGYGATWYPAAFDGTELRKDLRHLLKWSKSGR